jgi:hypothetical protein
MKDPLLTHIRENPDIKSIMELVKSKNETFKQVYLNIMTKPKLE